MTLEPYTYLTAFENGYTAASMIWDVRTVFDDYPNPPYVPENYDRDYKGPILFRDALALSLNIPAVKVMDLIGIDKVIDTMHSLGISTLHKEDVGLAMTLGGGEVRLLDHVYAFGVLANNGVMVGEPVPENQRQAGYRELNPASILRIEDARGDIIYSYTEPKTKEIISPQLAYLMQNVMSDNEARIAAFGEHNKLVLPDRPVAAKTGTTNDFRDDWTLGFTPQYVTGVWVGNADYRVMGEDAPSIKVAAPLWQQVMMYLHENEPVEAFSVPSNMVQVQICKKSGMLPTPNCPEVKTEIFIEGTQPTTPDTLFQTFRICGDTGLATVHCPANLIRNEVFMMMPPEAEDWARSYNIPRPPTAYDSSHGPVAGGDVSITNPAPYSYVRGNVSLDGNAFIPQREQTRVVTTEPVSGTETNSFEITESVSTFRLYRVQVGEGLDPPSWIQIGPDHFNYGRDINLESWNTYNFADGLYTVQLTAVEWNDNVQRSAIQVTVDNTPPSVELTYPYPNQLYELGGDSWLNFQADASDNIAMDKVEFYVNGNFFDSSSSSFNVRWSLEDANLAEGEERQAEIWAVAVDAAGNRTESQRIRIRVKERE